MALDPPGTMSFSGSTGDVKLLGHSGGASSTAIYPMASNQRVHAMTELQVQCRPVARILEKGWLRRISKIEYFQNANTL